jgi:hypothetical protein
VVPGGWAHAEARSPPRAPASPPTTDVAERTLPELPGQKSPYRVNRGPYLTNELRELSISAADLDVPDRAGAIANLVLWNGDPLEVTTRPERMWVRGQEVSHETRRIS